MEESAEEYFTNPFTTYITTYTQEIAMHIHSTHGRRTTTENNMFYIALATLLFITFSHFHSAKAGEIYQIQEVSQ